VFETVLAIPVPAWRLHQNTLLAWVIFGQKRLITIVLRNFFEPVPEHYAGTFGQELKA
jgi:hypothetical protein